MQMKRHLYSELVKELRDVPNIQSKRGHIISVLKKFGIHPEPVQSHKRVLLAIHEIDKDGFALMHGESGVLKAYCHFRDVGPGWYFDGGTFISPEQFAALDPAKYYVKEPANAVGTGLPQEVFVAPSAC